MSEAKRAIQSLNQPFLAQQLGALAPRLLRAESVACSWIEGLQTFEHDLAVPDGEPRPARPAPTKGGR